MCGLTGCIYNDRYKLDTNTFSKINNLLTHRGPDNQSISEFINYNLNFKFGHTRLSIQDLKPTANQPMYSKNGNLVILFNGEIYNHLELRKLYFSNYIWKTHSDTETLLVLFENFGVEKSLVLLEGMFAIALYNKKYNKIYLIRDRAGEKPLYVGLSKYFFSFSSDTKVFLKLSNFNKTINTKAVSQLLKLNYIKSPLSIYNNAFKIPPGSFIEINFDSFEFTENISFDQLLNLKGVLYKKWWKLNHEDIYKNTHQLDYSEFKKQIKSQLLHSIKQQQISDVPIGVFLSGGIDSSLITSIMSSIKNNINTFTIGFEDQYFDESIYANEISKYLGSNHTEHIFGKKDLLEIIPNLQEIYSEPFADSSQIPTTLLSKITSNKVKVALSGDGGDELFAGYNRYYYGQKYNFYINSIPDNLKILLINLIKSCPISISKYIFNFLLRKNIKTENEIKKIITKLTLIKNNLNFYDAMISEWLPNDNIMNNMEKNEDDFNNNNQKMNIVDFMMLKDFDSYLCDDILCKVDRASMHYSLEVRAPFLNSKLIEHSFQIPSKFKIKNNNTKFILKDILQNYLPKKYFEREKKGFAVPIANFLRSDLKEWAGDFISPSINNKHNLFNQNIINKTFNDHLLGNINNEHKLWSIIQFNSWYEKVYNG